MNAILHSRFAETLGWTLVHSLWQITLLALLVALALRLLKRSSPNARYAVACAGLLLTLIVPAVAYVTLLPPAPRVLSPQIAPADDLSHPSSPAVLTTLAPLSQKPTFRLRAALAPWLPIAVVVYALGAVFMIARLTLGFARLRGVVSGASALPDNITGQAVELARRMRLSRSFRLLKSAAVEAPTLIGAIKPVILLPASALTGLSIDQLSSLLAHEFAHIRRHDDLANLIQSVIETLLFYHPAVWWISSRIRVEREFCCDDAVVNAQSPRIVYARALAAMESLRAPSQLALGAAGGSLLNRIRRILEPSSSTSPRKLQTCSSAALVLILLGAIAFFALNRSSSASTASAYASAPAAKITPATLPASIDPDSPEKQIVLITLKILDVDEDSVKKLIPADKAKNAALAGDEVKKIVEKLMKDKQTVLISAPSIIVVGGQEANIQIGQMVPMLAAPEPDKKEDKIKQEFVGLSFNVKPSISDTIITLEMEISLSSLSTTGIPSAPDDPPAGFPVIQERKTKTGVKIPDGQTILIGSKSSEAGKENIILITAKKAEPGEAKEKLIQINPAGKD